MGNGKDHICCYSVVRVFLEWSFVTNHLFIFKIRKIIRNMYLLHSGIESGILSAKFGIKTTVQSAL